MKKDNEKRVPDLRFKGFDGDWKQRKLGDLALKIGSGKTPKGGNAVYKSAGILFLRSQNIHDDVVDLQDIAFINERTDLNMKNSRVAFQDILLNITGASIGRSAVYSLALPANVNQHVCIIRLKDTRISQFLQTQLASNHGQNQIVMNQAGGGREGLNFHQISKFEFSFPISPEEVGKIELLFQSLNCTIALHERKLALLKQLKKAYLQQLFPENGSRIPLMRFAGFTDDWEQRKLGMIASFFSGGTPAVGNSEYYNGKIPFIRSAELSSEKTELSITELGLKNSSAKMVNKGDLLYALYGATSGEVGRAGVDGAINQAILTIKPYTGFQPSFIQQWLLRSKNTITGTYLQGGQGNLSSAIIKKLELTIPSEREQNNISTLLDIVDDTIALHQRKLKKLQQLKRAYLQKLFV